ncbi:hypothetical protein DPMN_127547 [Dreissena polymorpha]|uniref:Uncharacterized protein n=1 Tax=Dreissena polymorpha TaxID=45954 RepID=A0A9D4JVJ7_DREPO|nr:hypothetical protein DPMN_127547 [Dreissena polymorpha]
MSQNRRRAGASRPGTLRKRQKRSTSRWTDYFMASPVLLNIFLEMIMQETFHDTHTSISIAGRSSPT